MEQFCHIFEEFFFQLKAIEMPSGIGVNYIAYAILKAEGDVLVDMAFFERAIKAYKTLKDFMNECVGA